MTIRWPAEFSPDKAPVYVSNRIEIAAPPEIVWAWLIRAEQWPAWYPNAKDVKITRPSRELALRVRFRWRTFGVGLESFVEECKAPERMAWSARGMGVQAYHAWLIDAAPQGCRVVTEETQHGWLAKLGKTVFPKRMSDQHQIWLERLKKKAEAGAPR